MFRKQLPRFYELRDRITRPASRDAYFQSFENTLQDPLVMAVFSDWEHVLQELDTDAWRFLKEEASQYLMQKDENRGWQQLFDILGQAHGYNYLKGLGCSGIKFIPRKAGRTPDLEGLLGSTRVLCEVKTINPSADQLRARREFVVRKGESRLLDPFFKKLSSTLIAAKGQLDAHDPQGDSKQIAYIHVRFDDWTGLYNKHYFQQIDEYLSGFVQEISGLEVVFYNYRTPFHEPITMTNAVVDNAR